MKGLIVGFGNMGQLHFLICKRLGVDILAVIDPEPPVMYKLGSTKPRVYTDLRSVPKSRLDFVVVATPTHLHLQHLKEAVAWQPKAVFLEKPLVNDQKAFIELIGLLKQNGQPNIFVGEVEQYNSCLKPFLAYDQSFKTIRFSRKVNLEHFLHGEKPWFLDENKSGGIVLALMIHDLNLLVGKYGSPERIIDVAGKAEKFGIIDRVAVCLKWPMFTAELDASWLSSDTQNPIKLSVDIIGSSGAERIYCNDYVQDLKAQNPYYIQMKTFLSSLKSERFPPIQPCLDALNLAIAIRHKLSK